MEIKRLVGVARAEFPDFDFVGDVDELDVFIEAMIRPDLFEAAVRVADERESDESFSSWVVRARFDEQAAARAGQPGFDWYVEHVVAPISSVDVVSCEKV
jgi:hypothetical protein